MTLVKVISQKSFLASAGKAAKSADPDQPKTVVQVLLNPA
jgi:hypothetical protein